jgi:ubiquinol-cytochrome c reductase iron-sulfur subunit
MTDNGNPTQGPHEPDGQVERFDTSTALPLDQGHIVGTGGIPEQFANPGLPPHVHRMADHDEGAARRAEKQVATLFGISALATVLFVVCYFAIPRDKFSFIPLVGQANISHVTLGVTLSISLLGIGMGAIHWAKTLMPDTEVVEERHTLRSAEEDRHGAVGTLLEGGQGAQIARRPLIKYTLGGALGLFAIPLVVQLVGSLGPAPGDELYTTVWKKGTRLVRDPELTPVKATDVTIGSVFHILPEGIDKTAYPMNEKAKAAVLLMRLDPRDILSQKELDWGYHGIVAYSQICTHVGCPVGLYEQQTHHLLCPCHQSTFDVTQDAKVIFGPAGHPLPQLKITVDQDGYLMADAPFAEPVGPSFWERG